MPQCSFNVEPAKLELTDFGQGFQPPSLGSATCLHAKLSEFFTYIYHVENQQAAQDTTEARHSNWLEEH